MDDVVNAAQIADIEQAMMSPGRVVAAQTASVHAEDDRKVLQADIVDDRIEGSLQEGGIDRAEGLESLVAIPAAKITACSSAIPTSK